MLRVFGRLCGLRNSAALGGDFPVDIGTLFFYVGGGGFDVLGSRERMHGRW